VDDLDLESLGIGGELKPKILEVINKAKAGVDNKNKELLGKLAKYKEQLGAYEGIDDPGEAKAALAKLKELETKKLMDQGEFDKLLAKHKQEYDTQVTQLKNVLGEKDRALAEKESAIKEHFTERAATDAILAYGANKHLLINVVKPSIRVTQENGKFVEQIVDANGNVRLNSNGEPMTPTEFVGTLKDVEHYAPAFPPEVKQGGGAKQTRQVGGRVDVSNLSAEQKMSLGRKGKK